MNLYFVEVHTIWTTPVDVPDRTPFDKDSKHMAYDSEYAHRVWCIIAHSIS